MELNLLDGELYDFDELVSVLNAEYCEDDDVSGVCPVCGHELAGIATFKLTDGTHVCQEESCLCDYYGVELVWDYGESDWEERIREYNADRL